FWLAAHGTGRRRERDAGDGEANRHAPRLDAYRHEPLSPFAKSPLQPPGNIGSIACERTMAPNCGPRHTPHGQSSRVKLLDGIGRCDRRRACEVPIELVSSLAGIYLLAPVVGRGRNCSLAAGGPRVPPGGRRADRGGW